MRRTRLALGLLLLVLGGIGIGATPAGAQWTPAGAPLCGIVNSDFPTDHLVIPDGAGGLFAAWRDARDNPNTESDVFLQRLTAGGYISAGWPANGLGICVATRDQTATWTAPDGQGGAFVTWIDHRGDSDIYLSRASANGTLAPGWPDSGLAVCRAPWSQQFPVVEPDGNGGAYVVWRDDRNYLSNLEDIYVQHVAADGSIVPGWPMDGVAVSVAPGLQYFPKLLADGQGGVVVVWADFDPASYSDDAHGVRLKPDGTIAPTWGTADKVLVAGGGAPQPIADGVGGFYLVTSTSNPGDPGFAGEQWVQRLTMDGEVAAGWPAQGLVVCSAPSARTIPQVEADGVGGVLMTWYDYRLPGGVIYAARVLPGGTIAPGWTVNGTLLSDPTAPGVEYDPAIAPDGNGGAYVVWNIEYGGVPAYVQHLTATGHVAPGWPTHGTRVSPGSTQFHPQIVSDGKGGAIVVWDERGGPRFGLYAQRFGFDGPVPALLALASASAEDGLVRLVWQGSDAALLEVSVERRREEATEWTVLARTRTDATGRLSYEDAAAEPGSRYAYRLRWREGGEEFTTGEAWVEVPRAAALVLEGLRPNPAVRDLDVAFTLAAAGPVRLELLDLAGRQVVVRELSHAGVGRHVERLGSAAQLMPGVYWLRLTQKGEQRLARGVVVR